MCLHHSPHRTFIKQQVKITALVTCRVETSPHILYTLSYSLLYHPLSSSFSLSLHLLLTPSFMILSLSPSLVPSSPSLPPTPFFSLSYLYLFLIPSPSLLFLLLPTSYLSLPLLPSFSLEYNFHCCLLTTVMDNKETRELGVTYVFIINMLCRPSHLNKYTQIY